MGFWIGSLVGCIIGSLVASIFYSAKRTYGTLRIDRSNPEKDLYQFVLSEKDLDDLSRKKHIVLKIDSKADFR